MRRSFQGDIAIKPARCLASTKFFLAAFAVLLPAMAATEVLSAPATQCSASAPRDGRGHWSWREIDGRRCWYEGKPGMSKSLLAWPEQAPAQTNSGAPEVTATEKHDDPLDAQASMPKDDDSFEARWRARATPR
jgi:hypothetical protein